MARFGSNMLMKTDAALRDPTRAVFEGPLGCTRHTPNDTIDVFVFADGGTIAVDYVAPERTLSAEQLRASGTWIEFAVDDEAATAAALEACTGVIPFSYVTEHRYFQLPGGQVFRLKK